MHQVIISYLLLLAVTKYYQFLFSWNVQYAGKHYSHRSLCFYRTMTHQKAEEKMPYSTYSISSWKYERMNHAYVNKLKKRTVIMRVLQIFSKVTLVSFFVIICYKLCNILILFNWFRYNHIKLFLLQW